MRIYRMTATFGKLEQQTLTLQPGLNVVEAPNEWGKSTWCAFLLAMLYGLDTRAKTTKAALADKERYAPWSGSPMSGRMDLCWNGRDITIERTTRGRVPMGVFRAYETESGLEIPELNAANCGQLLLGVEQSVFRRAGFIRQADMPVTRDDALRRRLNDLVTTGDETGDGALLEKRLRELKNRCRYNRSGLIPQTQEERDALEEKLQELDALENRISQVKNRLSQENHRLRLLENHRAALEYAKAKQDLERIAHAQEVKDRAERRMEEAIRQCAGLPEEEAILKRLAQLLRHQQQWDHLRSEQGGQEPSVPQVPQPFQGKTPEQIQTMVQQDAQQDKRLRTPWAWLGLLILGMISVILSAVMHSTAAYAIGLFAGGVVCLLLAVVLMIRCSHRRKALREKYEGMPPGEWANTAAGCIRSIRWYQAELQAYHCSREAVAHREQELTDQKQQLCGGQTLEQAVEDCREMLRHQEEYTRARQELLQREEHLNTVRSMARNAPPPAFADTLTGSPEDTAVQIADTRQECQHLASRLEQYRGRMEAMGDREEILGRIAMLNQRIDRLEEYHTALTLAQETLAQAQQELQRRFAPRISRRAQDILSQMTAGRYDRMTLQEDLSLLAGAVGENTVQSILWRSDGTVDQLYFALRLAVAEELTPAAPLILDDVFVRFDDVRLKEALMILNELRMDRQILLFTCQSRENNILRSQT